MTRSPPDRASGVLSCPWAASGAHPAAGRGSRASNRTLFMWAVAAVAAAAPVWGQTWRFVPSIALQETATNNVNLEPTDIRISDLVTQITPTLAFSESGEHTRSRWIRIGSRPVVRANREREQLHRSRR